MLKHWYLISLGVWGISGLPLIVLLILWLNFDLAAFLNVFTFRGLDEASGLLGLLFTAERIGHWLVMLHPLLLLPFGIAWKRVFTRSEG